MKQEDYSWGKNWNVRHASHNVCLCTWARERFFGWGAEIGEQQSNSKHTLCKTFFRKRYVRCCNVQRVLGQSPRSWVIFDNFCVKSSLTVCKTVSYRKKWLRRIGLYYLLPNNFVRVRLDNRRTSFVRLGFSGLAAEVPTRNSDTARWLTSHAELSKEHLQIPAVKEPPVGLLRRGGKRPNGATLREENQRRGTSQFREHFFWVPFELYSNSAGCGSQTGIRKQDHKISGT